MIYRKAPRLDIELSILGLGGHEYLSDGRSRGFNEDAALATTPGHIFHGFGGDKRKPVLELALERGINFLDVTQDSEKEALGRNLRESAPPHRVYVQARPEGMLYTYDENNARMARPELLRAEVERVLGLLQREQLDFLNLGFMQTALDHDPQYLDKIAGNIEALKAEGLIRHASADTFSGEGTYLRQIDADCFEAIFVSFNFADDCARHRVLPAAQAKGMAVITREVFMKGALFYMGQEVGLGDRDLLARTALKWNLNNEHVNMVVVGVSDAHQLLNCLRVLDDPQWTDEESAIIERIKASPTYKAYVARKKRLFGYEAIGNEDQH